METLRPCYQGELTPFPFSFTLGLVNTMGSRMVLNLRKQGAVEIAGSPPLNTHFIDTHAPYGPHDTEQHKYLATLQPQVYQPFGQPGRYTPQPPVKPPAPVKPPKAMSRDPYFYEKRANTLRHLKAKVGRTATSHSARSTKTVKPARPRHNLSAIFPDQPSGPSTLRAWSDINSAASVSVSQLGTEDGEAYDMELLPVPVSTAGRRGDVGGRLRPGFQRWDTDAHQGPSSLEGYNSSV